MRASTLAEGRSDQGVAAAIPQPTVTAAAPAPAPAAAVVALPHHLRLPQHLPAVRLNPPPHGGRGGVAAPLPTRLAGAAAVTAPTGTAVIVVRRAGTGGGAAPRDQPATRKTAVIPGSAGAAGVDPDPERETGAEPGPETAAVAAETEKRRKKGIRRGKGAVMAETAVIVVAANTSRRPPAKTGRGGGKEVIATRKTRKRGIKTGTESQIKREKSQSPKRRTKKKEALWLQRRMANRRKGKRLTHAQTLRVTSTPGRIAKPARRAPPKLARGAQTLIQVDPLPLKLARKRNLKDPNVVAQGRRKNLTSLVRRQAANTSLSRDQGSIRFFLLFFLLYVSIVCLIVISLESF